jgi:hypothetical protein
MIDSESPMAREDREYREAQRARLRPQATEQARETPEPLTPGQARDAMLRTLQEERVYGPRRQRIEDAADRMVAAALAALRAATPDPDECERSDGSGLLCVVHGRALWPSLARRCNGAATPDPAEPGLREALQGAVDAWTAEYGPDDNAPWVTKALRALSDTTEPGLGAEFDRAVLSGRLDGFDAGTVRRLRAALSDTTEGQS